MAKDLYSALGVTRTESLHGIREAFRKLAKRYHPDHAGQQGTQKFQEILNAYEVLSDPEKRKRYNERLARRSLRSEPVVVTRRAREPLFRRFSAESYFGPGWKGPAFESLDFAVSLSSANAAKGATVWLRLPIRYLCPACSGTGEQWPFPCGFCQQSGVIHHEREVRLQLPPGVQNRALVEIPADRLGTHYRVRLFVTVDAPS